MIVHSQMPAHWLSIVFAISATGTAILALAVMRGWVGGLDRRLLEAWPYRNLAVTAGKPRKRVTAARDVAALGGDAVRTLFLLSCAAELLAARRAQDAAVLIGSSVLARLALVLVKAVIRRPRPRFGDYGLATYTSSFPSGHTFMTVVVSVSAAVILPRDVASAVTCTAIGLALTLSLAIGIARMSFGVHWPSDVLAGWLAGVAWVSGSLLLI